MSEIDYEKLAGEIAKKLRALPAPERIIWTAKQCAEYLGISERHYVDRLSKTYGFPTPIKLPSESGRGHSRWYANEVQVWVVSHRNAS